jgi:hypothetical protein
MKMKHSLIVSSEEELNNTLDAASVTSLDDHACMHVFIYIYGSLEWIGGESS